jgi:cytochrome c oxidase assembly factor CtaG
MSAAMAAVAGGYAGPPDLTLASGLTSWTFDLGAFALVAALGFGYVAGLRRVRASGGHWSAARATWFFAGLVVLALTSMSFLGVYSHTLVWVTAAQMAVLLTVVPVLLVLGAPVSLLVAARPAAQMGVERFLANPVVRLATFPLVGAVVVAMIPFAVYYTPVFEASLRNSVVAWLVHLGVLAVGLSFYWTVLSIDRPPRVHYVALTVVVMAETLFDAVPGIALWLGTRPIAAGYYRQVARPWGRSLLSDQQFGGIMLWGIGELVGIPLLMLVVVQWMRSDVADAARIDRELDLADEARAAAARRASAGSEEPPGYQGIDRNGEE